MCVYFCLVCIIGLAWLLISFGGFTGKNDGKQTNDYSSIGLTVVEAAHHNTLPRYGGVSELQYKEQPDTCSAF